MRLGCAEIPLVLMYSVANPLIVQERFIFLAMGHVFCHTRIGRYTVAPAPTVNRNPVFWLPPPCGPKTPFGLGSFCLYRGALRQNELAQNLFYFALRAPTATGLPGTRPWGYSAYTTLSHKQGQPCGGACPCQPVCFFVGCLTAAALHKNTVLPVCLFW